MDLRQLEYFVAVAETSSFTRAAVRCHSAQSALSHQVARLESQLGQRLFDRTSRSVVLTSAGEILLPLARRILEDVADARGEISALESAVYGRVRVGMTQTAARLFDLARQLGDFSRSFPEVELSVLSAPGFELIDEVASGRLDVVIAAKPSAGIPAGVRFRLLAKEPLVGVVPAGHRLSRRKRVSVKELAEGDRFVEFRPNTGLRNRVDWLFLAAGLPQRAVSFEVGQITEMVRFARFGLGVTIVPAVFANDSEVAGDRDAPIVMSLSDGDAHLAIGEFMQERQPSAAVRAFSEMLAGEFGSKTLVG